MTVPGPSRPTLERERAIMWAEPILGPRIAQRIDTFGDDVLYVKAGGWARFLSWLVDFVVFVLGLGVAFVILAVVDLNADLDNATLGIALIASLFVVPLLYGGLCYRNGRALGGVFTGTQLVRFADGGRIGGRAPWVMLGRILMPWPLFFVLLLVSALAGGGSAPGGGVARVCVDVRATRRLRAAAVRP